MTTEEAAQDPKRNPKKRRANHTQKQHTTTTPKSGTAAKSCKASKGPQNEKTAAGEEEPTKQNKSPQRTKYEARQGRKASDQSGKPEKLPPIDGPQEKRKASEETTTDHRQHNRSPTEARNERKPIKYTPTTENATTGEIIKPTTKDGQTAEKPEKPTQKLIFPV